MADEERTGPAVRHDWQTRPLPERHVAMQVGRRYDARQMEAIGRGLVPEVMEDKWFLFFEDGCLHMHRSWTGVCIYRAHFEPSADGAVLTRVEINRDTSEYTATDDGHDVEQMLYLIDLLLLGGGSEPPRAPGDGAESAALRLWGLAGPTAFGLPRKPSFTVRPPEADDERDDR